MNEGHTRTRGISFSCVTSSKLDFHEQYCQYLVYALAELFDEMIQAHGQAQAREIILTAFQKVERDIFKD